MSYTDDGFDPLDALLARTDRLAEVGRLDDALATVHEALSLNPDSEDALALRAGLLVDLDRPSDARAATADIFRVNPESAQGWLLHAQVLHLIPATPTARIEAAERAVALNPERAFASYLLCATLLDQRRRPEAGEVVTSMFARFPDSQLAHLAAAEVELYDASQPTLSRRQTRGLLVAIVLTLGWILPAVAVVWAYHRHRRHKIAQRADQHLHRALAINSDDAFILKKLANSPAIAHRPARQVDYFVRAGSSDPNSVDGSRLVTAIGVAAIATGIVLVVVVLMIAAALFDLVAQDRLGFGWAASLTYTATAIATLSTVAVWYALSRPLPPGLRADLAGRRLPAAIAVMITATIALVGFSAPTNPTSAYYPAASARPNSWHLLCSAATLTMAVPSVAIAVRARPWIRRRRQRGL
ncbi:MAG: hypothetical protein DHS20C19_10350 [Acidimicrobiales bacterium]|nr:MAG: hypothetical protein DHS20C19_10350 [Acidimicrobiales bacterium]